jgi:tRNA(Arg) A34 adenosine deaminase TadA
MCAAAAAIARLKAVRFAAEDPKGGAVFHGPRIYTQPTIHHRPDVLGGIGDEQAGALLKKFFEERR